MASSLVVALVLSQFLPLVQTSCVASLEDLETAVQSIPLNVESINEISSEQTAFNCSTEMHVFYFVNDTFNIDISTARLPSSNTEWTRLSLDGLFHSPLLYIGGITSNVRHWGFWQLCGSRPPSKLHVRTFSYFAIISSVIFCIISCLAQISMLLTKRVF